MRKVQGSIMYVTIVHNTEYYSEILSDVPACKDLPEEGYRRTRSFRGLTRTSTPFKQNIPLVRGNHKCGQGAICSIMLETKEIVFADLNIKHKLCFFSNCKTKFRVYLLICECKLRYVGSTCRQLKVRVLGHRSGIKRKIMEALLTQHCLEKGHDFNNFRCTVLEVLDTRNYQHSDSLRVLRQRETFWIHKLKSLIPGGLNEEIDFSVFL